MLAQASYLAGLHTLDQLVLRGVSGWCPYAKVDGVLSSLPNINRAGVHQAIKTRGNCRSQSFQSIVTASASCAPRERLNLSTKLSLCGWRGVVLVLQIPSCLHIGPPLGSPLQEASEQLAEIDLA